jgi:hypothetical protein
MSIYEEIARELAEIRAEREIRNVILRYMRGVDRKDYELMVSTYHEDAVEDHGPIKLSPRDFVEGVRKRHETIEQASHFIGNCLIEIEGDRAFAETYCISIEHERAGTRNPGTGQSKTLRTATGVRYVDRFEKRNGSWKVAHRILVTEWSEENIGNIDFASHWMKAERSRDDAIYKIREL